MSSSSTSTSSMTIITLVKFSSIVCRIDAQISIFRCLTKATNSALSSSSSSEFPLSSLQTHTHTHYCYSIFSHARTRSDCSLTSAVPGSAEEKMLASLLLD
jgi:hypothetical protein